MDKKRSPKRSGSRSRSAKPSLVPAASKDGARRDRDRRGAGVSHISLSEQSESEKKDDDEVVEPAAAAPPKPPLEVVEDHDKSDKQERKVRRKDDKPVDPRPPPSSASLTLQPGSPEIGPTRRGKKKTRRGSLTPTNTADMPVLSADGQWEGEKRAASSTGGRHTTSAQAEGVKQSWKDCQVAGERWANSLWQSNKTGPAELEPGVSKKKKQWQTPPAPVRSDPERKKRDGPGPDKGPGPGPSGQSSGSTLLLEMRQATVRELRT